MRTTILLLVTMVTFVVAVTLVLPRLQATPASIAVQSQGPTIQRLERLSHLVTTRVAVADVLIGEGEGCRGSWLIRGDALIGVDLSRAQILDKDDQARRATVRLPPPEVMQARVDHQRSRTWQVSRMAWLPWNADQHRLRDAVMFQAQQLVVQAAGSAESIQQAKTTAEAIITAFYGEVGWQVEVTWEPKAARRPRDGAAIRGTRCRRPHPGHSAGPVFRSDCNACEKWQRFYAKHPK